MGKQYRIRRLLTSIPVVENNFGTYELPRGYDLESLTLRLRGSVNVTAAGTVVRADAPCQLIPRVEIVSNGQQTHYSAPFWHAVFLSTIENSANANQAKALCVPPSAASIANYTIEATGLINFQTADGERPKDTNLMTAGMSLFTLRLTFGNGAQLFTGAPTAVFTGFVDVETTEMVEEVDAQGNRTFPAFIKKVSSQEVDAVATTTGLEVLLPSGNLFRSVSFRTQLGTGEPGIGILNAARLESGTDVRARIDGPMTIRNNAHRFGWLPTGYYHVDVARNSEFCRLSELWDLRNQAQPKAVLDVTGAASQKIQTVITEYIPLA